MNIKTSFSLRWVICLMLCFVFKPKAQAQNNELEISLITPIGLNLSFFEMAKGSKIMNAHLIGAKDIYMGLGVQAQYMNDWTVSALLSDAWLGGGYKYYTTSISTTSAISLNFSLNVEKKVFESQARRIKRKKLSYRMNLLLGSGFHWIPPSDMTIQTGHSYSNTDISTPLNQVTGAINTGLTHQFIYNSKPKFKLSMYYTYAWKPARMFDYTVTFYGLPDSPTENFKVYTGKHRLVLSLEYPIVLYRNKAQKDFYKNN